MCYLNCNIFQAGWIKLDAFWSLLLGAVPVGRAGFTPQKGSHTLLVFLKLEEIPLICFHFRSDVAWDLLSQYHTVRNSQHHKHECGLHQRCDAIAMAEGKTVGRCRA